MYNLRARYYQPGSGRFWTMDNAEGWKEDPLSLHKYAYCHSSPLNGVDPTGHDFELGSFLANFSGLSIFAGLANVVQEFTEDDLEEIASGTKKIAGIVYSETGGIYPALSKGATEGGVTNWNPDSRKSLNKAREKIAEVANSGENSVAPPVYPKPKTPAAKAQWKDCQDAAKAAKGKTSDYKFCIWPSDDGKVPTQTPRLPPKWPYDYSKNIQERYGPFRVPTKVGDVPAGNNIYIFFYGDVP
jgi:hypothetical protein